LAKLPGIELKTDAPNGPDESRAAARLTQLLAQITDMNIHHVVVAIPLSPPHRREQLRSGEDPPRFRRQFREDVEFNPGQVKWFAVQLDRTSVHVDPESVKFPFGGVPSRAAVATWRNSRRVRAETAVT
jgi:hypothetical protein